MTTETTDKVEELYQKLTDCLNMMKLGVAGRFLYYENNMFILAVHAQSPEKTHEATSLVWDSLPDDLKEELKEAKIGFAGKQI